jgi:hypothetical protein
MQEIREKFVISNRTDTPQAVNMPVFVLLFEHIQRFSARIKSCCPALREVI